MRGGGLVTLGERMDEWAEYSRRDKVFSWTSRDAKKAQA
jgi:hypothetical protein